MLWHHRLWRERSQPDNRVHPPRGSPEEKLPSTSQTVRGTVSIFDIGGIFQGAAYHGFWVYAKTGFLGLCEPPRVPSKVHGTTLLISKFTLIGMMKRELAPHSPCWWRFPAGWSLRRALTRNRPGMLVIGIGAGGIVSGSWSIRYFSYGRSREWRSWPVDLWRNRVCQDGGRVDGSRLAGGRFVMGYCRLVYSRVAFIKKGFLHTVICGHNNICLTALPFAHKF